MNIPARDLILEALDHDDAQILLPPTATLIGTKGRLNLMDLPTEIRVKVWCTVLLGSSPDAEGRQIYEDVLISPHELNIPSEVSGSNVTSRSNDFTYPANAILQTCKLVNQEATPIFYGRNTFKICLATEHCRPFFVRNFRWSTLLSIDTIKFHSSGSAELGTDPSSITAPTRPYFACSGYDLMAVLKGTAFLYSPVCPDNNMALSISSWVSTKVLYLELDAIQKEMEAIMSTS
ncbi:hypothetical protein BUE80_DR011188 [Diplocarpon rosae]|nr:hypothetical protein BUE80_DR011188 [Diplocarpon rosae]